MRLDAETQPFKGPLQDAPLALCDARTVAEDDLVASDLVYKARVGETYSVTYNPAHRWYYAPELRRDEALLLKIMDSKNDGRAGAGSGGRCDAFTSIVAIGGGATGLP